jgi:hypothetical protein
MMHRTEAFQDPDAGWWGWQCDCGAQEVGYPSLLIAEDAGQDHTDDQG